MQKIATISKSSNRLLWAAFVCCLLVSCVSPTKSLPPVLPTPTTDVNLTPFATSDSITFQWGVEIVQGGEALAEQNHEIRLQKHPFTIRLTLSTPEIVRLHTFTTDASFSRVHEGVKIDDWDLKYCLPEAHPFCSYMAMTTAEGLFNDEEQLVVFSIVGEGHQTWYYNSPDDHRWSNVEFTAENVIFERKVSYLSLQSKDSTIGIEEFQGDRLYLLFLVKYQRDDTIHDNEVGKTILVFDE